MTFQNAQLVYNNLNNIQESKLNDIEAAMEAHKGLLNSEEGIDEYYDIEEYKHIEFGIGALDIKLNVARENLFIKGVEVLDNMPISNPNRLLIGSLLANCKKSAYNKMKVVSLFAQLKI